MGYSFNSLGLLYELLEELDAFVVATPPPDIADRLPALIIEASAPVQISNYSEPGAGAKITFTLSALAEDHDEAFELCDKAYSMLWDKRHSPTKWGWLNHLSDVQAPTLVTSDQAADHVFQYTAALEAIIRKNK